MRFHVTALPHTNSTRDFLACAYTAKIIGFCRMMMDRGHEVFLYGGESNEAPCTEHVACVTEEERAAFVGARHFTAAPFDPALPFWRKTNARMAAEIAKRARPKDFLCVIGGYAQKPIADALPGMMAVEFGIGYGGTFSKYRVFESYAWMHTVIGAQTMGKPHDADGSWWDAVIPGYLDPAGFPFAAEKQNYLLFVGRLIERKGYGIALEVANALGLRLVVAGQGTPPQGCDYRGVVGPEERGHLMANARALFCPTIYVEPFANVHVEAMTCGTPVICTDWGVYTETVEEGITGFRCHTFAEFKRAAEMAPGLDPHHIRARAIERFSLPVVAAKYERYFERLLTLWGKGWYEESPALTA